MALEAFPAALPGPRIDTLGTALGRVPLRYEAEGQSTEQRTRPIRTPVEVVVAWRMTAADGKTFYDWIEATGFKWFSADWPVPVLTTGSARVMSVVARFTATPVWTAPGPYWDISAEVELRDYRTTVREA